ncbi:MAG: AzlC family ABC transporter permease [Candidatus Anaerobiospirillum pullicola]|uniref:AzlC family ABC transporter permease n=1 Tax=Candidatus Anaerobiospirillum pullicola TaxID=2838451 RepID=A0A948X2B6_9GAMM|nr:AzlC family ABC transporter permease [Candidatus Anaerobiospirillum pullicola]
MYSEIRRGFFSALPLMMGFIPLAIILGAQASQVGMSTLGSYLLPALNLAGGSEFAALGLWQAVPPVLMIVMTTFLINSRHIIMGAALAPYIRQESGLRIMLIYFLMCDETWSLAFQDIQRRMDNKQSPFSFHYYLGVGLSLWLNWSLAALCGSLLGRFLGDLSLWGFAMALPATFIGLSIGLRPRKDMLLYIPIAISFILSGGCAALFDAKYAVGCGAIGGLVGAYFVQIYKEKHGLAATTLPGVPVESAANATQATEAQDVKTVSSNEADSPSPVGK